MNVREDHRLKLHCQDGLQFIQDAEEHVYDVVIVDVAAQDMVRKGGLSSSSFINNASCLHYLTQCV